MDLEQLKATMDSIGIATGAAKTFGIFWLVIQLLKYIFAYSLGAGIAFGVYKVVNRLIRSFIENDLETLFMKKLRKMVRADGYGHITDSEREEILEVFKLGLKANK
ncbi:MAG: hypothetical protein BBJ57_02335 [Desulfobacterales bacterium PC51MH44]|nr:MAG: hypothetical protein BBJ57_02335 [Desulfobacterales bacterium PC51MH44]